MHVSFKIPLLKPLFQWNTQTLKSDKAGILFSPTCKYANHCIKEYIVRLWTLSSMFIKAFTITSTLTFKKTRHWIRSCTLKQRHKWLHLQNRQSFEDCYQNNDYSLLQLNYTVKTVYNGPIYSGHPPYFGHRTISIHFSCLVFSTKLTCI